MSAIGLCFVRMHRTCGISPTGEVVTAPIVRLGYLRPHRRIASTQHGYIEPGVSDIFRPQVQFIRQAGDGSEFFVLEMNLNHGHKNSWLGVEGACLPYTNQPHLRGKSPTTFSRVKFPRFRPIFSPQKSAEAVLGTRQQNTRRRPPLPAFAENLPLASPQTSSAVPRKSSRYGRVLSPTPARPPHGNPRRPARSRALVSSSGARKNACR
jgi:hypothetical protein